MLNKRDPRDFCGLCGKKKDEVQRLVAGLNSSVCSECVALCNDILQVESPKGGRAIEGLAPVVELREHVNWGNQQLPKLGLVTMHSGNVSAYDPQANVVYIKPSGMDYDRMEPKDIVVVSIDGDVVEPGRKPSVDLPHHLFLYRNMPGVRAVVHTHSNYATAFAACHKPIPLALTAIADEFGGEIPCAPYVDNEGDNIGQAILKYKGRGPAILMGNHGVFAWGPSVSAALKAAAMVEDVAKTLAIAGSIGDVVPIDPAEAEKWFDRYANRYGQ